MDEETQKEVDEIREKWIDTKIDVCKNCMTDAIGYWERHGHSWCCGDRINLPDKYDGDVYASAGIDIQTLLGVIDKLTKGVK